MKKNFYISLICLCLHNFALIGDTLPNTNILKEGHFPTPFSADQIRKQCRNGYFVKFYQKSDGTPAQYTLTSFHGNHPKMSRFDYTLYDKEMKKIRSQKGITATWTSLQAHASFDKRNTQLKQVVFETRLGEKSYDCWLYIREIKKESRSEREFFYFAKKIPGPPILFTRKIDRKEVFRMEMIAFGTTEKRN